MLFSARLIHVAADCLSQQKTAPLVVDPVMIATSGARLLKSSAAKALRDRLLPLAALVTPNCDEAEELTGLRIREPEHLRRAARWLHERFGCAALVKGGHLTSLAQAADVFYDGKTELLLTAPFVRGVSTHGTGCTYSAAVTAHLACGRSLPEAVKLAKQYISEAIARSQNTGRHSVLNWMVQPGSRS